MRFDLEKNIFFSNMHFDKKYKKYIEKIPNKKNAYIPTDLPKKFMYSSLCQIEVDKSKIARKSKTLSI